MAAGIYWVWDNSTKSYRKLGIHRAPNPSLLECTSIALTEMPSFPGFPILFRERRVICKWIIPRTAQYQMVSLMPAASRMEFYLLVYQGSARRAVNLILLLLDLQPLDVLPRCVSHILPLYKDPEILVSLAVKLAACEMEFLLKRFSSR